MFELRNLYKLFGDVRVLDRVNIRLERDLVYALKSSNGLNKYKRRHSIGAL